MGSIFKRGDVFYVSFKDAAGRRVKRAAGRDLAEAQRQLQSVETRPPLPAGLPQGVYPFTLAAKDYLPRLSIYGRPTSIKNSGTAVKHLLASFDSRDVNRLRSANLDTYILTRRNAGVKDRTINTELIVLRAVLNHAVQTENIPKLPVRVRLLKVTKTLDKGVSIETTRQLGGWASVVMVQTYATTADRAKREAVEQLPF